MGIRQLSTDLTDLADACRRGAAGESGGRPGLARLAARHRVSGFYAAATGDRDGVEVATSQSLAQLAQCQRLAAALAPVRPLFLKGLAVAALGSTRPLLKQAADIDLLVEPRNLETAAAALAGLGYVRVPPGARSSLRDWHAVSNQSVWSDGNHIVELHHRAIAAPGPFTGLGDRRQAVALEGVSLETFDDDAQYIYLALHGGFSGWFRLKWLADFAFFCARRTDRLEEFHARAVAAGAESASSLALTLSQRLFALPLPDALSSTVRTDPVARILARISMRMLEGGEPTARRLGTLPLHVASLLLVRDPRLVVRGWHDTWRRSRLA